MTLITIHLEYSNFVDVFCLKLVAEFPEHIKINNHTINLMNSKQLSYKPIYSLASIELKTLKTYIKTNIANRFIRFSKLPTDASIFFIPKHDGSLCPCVDYRDLNNPIIRNQYPLSLIYKSLDWPSWAKQFIPPDLIGAYY